MSLAYVRYWLFRIEKEQEDREQGKPGPHKNMMAWLWVWGEQPKFEDEVYYTGKSLAVDNWDMPHENRVPEQYSKLFGRFRSCFKTGFGRLRHYFSIFEPKQLVVLSQTEEKTRGRIH